jgi:sigma-B regulation protein RsbU (phosphoserine phosphatase)
MELEIETAQHAKEAFGKLTINDYDLIISDLKMPELDGIEFLSIVSELYPNTSRILLSGNADIEDLDKAINQCNLDHYVSKPWDPNELRVKTEEILCQNRYNRRKKAIARELSGELKDAANLQLNLLPSPIDSEDVYINWLYQSCSQLGGDAFGYSLSENKLQFFLIDVVGHGAAAAMESFALQHLLSRSDLSDPANVAAEMNSNYAYTHDPMRYFTMLAGELDIKTGELVFCQAGHPSPKLVNRAKSEVLKVGSNGYPIGLIEGVSFENQTLTLSPDDLLIVYSDGLAEEDCHDFRDCLESSISMPSTKIIDNVSDWRLQGPIDDDISALFLSIR